MVDPLFFCASKVCDSLSMIGLNRRTEYSISEKPRNNGGMMAKFEENRKISKTFEELAKASTISIRLQWIFRIFEFFRTMLF